MSSSLTLGSVCAVEELESLTWRTDVFDDILVGCVGRPDGGMPTPNATGCEPFELSGSGLAIGSDNLIRLLG
jgi:hypothetical protein